MAEQTAASVHNPGSAVSPSARKTRNQPDDVVPAAPTVSLVTGPLRKLGADAVVVGLRPGEDAPTAAEGADEVDAAFDHRLAACFAAVGATGAAEQVHLLPGPKRLGIDVVAAVGLGEPGSDDDRNREAIRRAVGAAVRALAGSATTVAVCVSPTLAEAAAAAEGAALGGYAFDRFRTKPVARTPVGAVVVLAGGQAKADLRRADARARTVTTAVNRARDLVNTPPSHLVPAGFAERAQTLARAAGCTVDVLDEEALADGGFGGILGVGQGSVNPPRLVAVSHRPRRPVAHVALVGKGITFDSGGLSLKPTSGMLTMKMDMAGAAAVLATALAAAELDLPVRVDAWCALAENMPGGSATRPSDVLTMRNGSTCEVRNTDAEGRLVLADGIARASEDGPDLILDVATLTGACIVALGKRTFGVMGNDDDLRDRVVRAAGEVGEAAWPLPLLEEAPERLESKVADIAHWSPSPPGGALTAAGFLSTFVGPGIPWAHLDIAGPAFNDDAARGYLPSGGTGASVRTMLRLLETAAVRD